MSTTIEIHPVSFSYATAALATGYSEETIKRAVRAGDIEMVHPVVNGTPLHKGTIPAASLARWVATAASERAA